MGPVEQITSDGQTVMARALGFEPVREPWCEYEFADGGSARLRVTALKFYWVCDADGNPQRHPLTGEPWVVVNHAVQLAVNTTI